MGYGNAYDCCGPWFARRYSTREERISRLKEYQAALESEIKAVSERIEDLSKE